VFDNQILAQILMRGYSIGEISCPTSYHPNASSIEFKRSVTYGLGVLKTTIELLTAQAGIYTPTYLQPLPIRSKSREW
jgi:hypothetical protein